MNFQQVSSKLSFQLPVERKGTVYARSRAAADDMMNQLSLFPSSLLCKLNQLPKQPSPPSVPQPLLQSRPLLHGAQVEGDVNSVVTACAGRSPPGSGHHKDFLQTRSYREEVGREKQEALP